MCSRFSKPREEGRGDLDLNFVKGRIFITTQSLVVVQAAASLPVGRATRGVSNHGYLPRLTPEVLVSTIAFTAQAEELRRTYDRMRLKNRKLILFCHL